LESSIGRWANASKQSLCANTSIQPPRKGLEQWSSSWSIHKDPFHRLRTTLTTTPTSTQWARKTISLSIPIFLSTLSFPLLARSAGRPSTTRTATTPTFIEHLALPLLLCLVPAMNLKRVGQPSPDSINENMYYDPSAGDTDGSVTSRSQTMSNLTYSSRSTEKSAGYNARRFSSTTADADAFKFWRIINDVPKPYL